MTKLIRRCQQGAAGSSRGMILVRRIAVLTGLALAMSLSALSGADAQRRPPPSDQGTTPPPKVEKQFPVGFSWTAASLNGKPYGGERPTLRIDDVFRGTGFSGCNTFSATTYPLREMGFAVGPVAVTRRACDGGAMAIERAFLVALRTAQKWDLVSGQLVLSGPNGTLRFERAI
jgi:heat shock protein HslJ